MGATLYRDFGRTGADTALGAASAATASVTSTAAAAAAAPPALTSSRDTKGGELLQSAHERPDFFPCSFLYSQPFSPPFFLPHL